jgi:hypothetical protein
MPVGSSTRVIGEAVAAISKGNYARVKGFGIFIKTEGATRKRRSREEMTRDKKKETAKN